MLYEVITIAILLSVTVSIAADTIGVLITIFLENEVIPCFYDRKNGDLPGQWVQKMKATMRMAIVITSYSIHYTKLYDRPPGHFET